MTDKEMSVLILRKLPLDLSPDYDAWSLKSLSYRTTKKYFPNWGCVYNYEKDIYGNDLHSVITKDPEIVKKMTEKMKQVDKYHWEYTGHVCDLTVCQQEYRWDI